MQKERRRGGLVGPVFLIGLGAVLLLNNLGLLKWEVWNTLWRLWPVLLIALGVEVLFGRRSLLGSLLAALVVLAALFGGIWYGEGHPPNVEQVAESIRQPLNGATRAEVHLRFGIGRVHISPHPDGDLLLVGTFRGTGGRVRQEFRRSGDLARLELSGPEGLNLPFFGAQAYQPTWDLQLHPGVPTRLEVHNGVGTADLDLAALTLTELHLETGVGKTSVTLPSRGQYAARIEGGVGETIVTIPSGLAARIRIDTGVGEARVLGDFLRRDDLYLSPNYETAADRVDLRVDGGVGRVTVRAGD